MRTNFLSEEVDVIHSALLCVLDADVISREKKRSLVRELATLRATSPCAPDGCGECDRRAGCEARVLDLMGTS